MWELALSNSVWLTVVGGAAVAMLGLLHRVERACGSYVARKLGWRAVIVTGWLGVPVHELGHLGMALLFGHRIVAWSLFDPDPVTGTLGYVRHAYRRRTLWQICGNFWIGVAPVVSGGLALLALAAWALPPSVFSEFAARAWGLGADVAAARMGHELSGWLDPAWAQAWWELGGDGLLALWQGRSVWFPLQVYLCLCVCCHMAPSRADLKQGGVGALITVLAALALAVGCAAVGRSIAALAVVLLPLAAVCGCATVFLVGYGLAVAMLLRIRRWVGDRR